MPRPASARHSPSTKMSSPSVTAGLNCARAVATVAAAAAALARKARRRIGIQDSRASSAIEEFRDRGAAVVADIHAVVVYVEIDVLAHDVIVHLESMRPYVRHDLGFVRPRELQARPNRIIQHTCRFGVDVVANQNRA